MAKETEMTEGEYKAALGQIARYTEMPKADRTAAASSHFGQLLRQMVAYEEAHGINPPRDTELGGKKPISTWHYVAGLAAEALGE